MRTSVKIICNECGKEIFGSAHIQNIDRLTHNNYGLYSIEHESCVAIIIHDKIDHIYSHYGNLVCESCYEKLNSEDKK